MAIVTDEELIDILENRIPALLERRPELQNRVYSAFVDLFAKRSEVAAIMQELRQLGGNLQEFQVETRQRFDQVDQRLEGLDRKFEDLRDWVELVIGRMQVRSGRNLENVVAGAMRVALNRPDIRPEQIKMRQKIVDPEGDIFPRGRQKEVDLIASNGEYLVFEVKSAAEVEDVENFAEKVALIQHQHPDKTVQGIFITLAPEPDVQKRCAELGIELAR